MKKKSVMRNYRVEPDLDQRLAKAADAEGISVSELIRKLTQQYLASFQAKTPAA